MCHVSSITMTLLSTVLALGFMPLNMFIYLRSWTGDQATIPFVEIVIIILLTWIPVGIGMFIRHKAKRPAKYIVRVRQQLEINLNNNFL